mgnify:CR=1 FL=1
MPGKTCDTMTHSTIPALRMTDVHKRFGDNEVLRGASLHVAPGEVIAILGSSGSGKSTLLRCINHLETIERGCIEIAGETLVCNGPDGRASYPNDREVRRICSHTGMVFQHFNLFPHMTVLQNLIEALRKLKRCCARSACWTSATPIRDGFQAGKSSAWPSLGRLPCSRPSCCLTNPPARSTPSSLERFFAPFGSWRPNT